MDVSKIDIEEIDRVILIGKIHDGDELNRDDLQYICRLLGNYNFKIPAFRDLSEILIRLEPPKRIKGYKVKGQGAKCGSKQPVITIKIEIAKTYLELKKSGFRQSQIIEKLKADLRFSSYTDDVIIKYKTEGMRYLRGNM